jgi:septal ring factor EnvC (AmiA/AmiB activator)
MRIFVFLSVLIISLSSFAQTAKIKELEKQRVEALRDISNTDQLLRETKKTTSTLLDRINLIANQIFSRQKVLGLLEQEVNGISAEQQQIEKDIIALETELEGKKSSYAKAIDAMQRSRQNENKLLFVLSGKSLTESYRRIRYLREYSEWRKDQADEIKEHSAKLKERKDALAKMKYEKMTLIGLREREQNNLKVEETNYQKEVNEAQNKQKDLQKTLTQKRQQADALNRQIAKLIAEEVARQEREAKRKAAGKNSSASSGGTAKAAASLSAENIILSNNFAANKGKLPYPISGNYTITTHYGTHQHSKWNVTTSSNGIDIRSQAGADAKAVFDGEVTYVAAIPGYNTCIIVRHGNYYSFYGNIQSIYIKQGNTVKTGQALGKVYTDIDTGYSQMHFQLWQGTSKMNPEPWLR